MPRVTALILKPYDLSPLSLSKNKINLINRLSDVAEIELLDRAQFFFPIIQFHSRWTELTEWDLDHSVNGMKAGLVNNAFLYMNEDLTDTYKVYENQSEPSEEQITILEELLDFCEQEDLSVLFVNVPQALSKTSGERMNWIEDTICQRGFDFINILEIADDLGLQKDADYFDRNHTNVHGSIKYTDYLARYLVENYGFEDKRGQPGWESWDEAVALYDDVIGPYTLSLERWHEPRNYDLAAPKLSKLKVDGQTITVSWGETEGAEGYDVYRKAADEYDGYWVYVATVEGGLTLTDYGLFPGTKYTYTVVPFDHGEDGTMRYGNFDYSGVSAATEEEAA